MIRPSRRQVVQGAGAVGLGLVAGCGRWPWQAQAPPAGSVHRIGLLDQSSADDPYTLTFWEALGDLGYTEGHNLVVESRFAAGNLQQLPALAAELAASNVELIVAMGNASANAAREAAPQIPIVVARGGGDPVGAGRITSFARPGGNVTGVVTATVEIAAKWLELLKEAVPAISRVALLADHLNETTDAHLREIARAAESLQVRLQSLGLDEPEALTAAFTAMQQEHAEALVLVPGGRASLQASRIAALALAHGLPAVAEWRTFTVAGGLMSYGPSRVDLARRAASFVDRILKGAKPADLPVERPMRFDFVINATTAQALRLTIPQHVLLQATEVIQ
jgi:putative tryptophan/tyrosine transport system substrate-binding protein